MSENFKIDPKSLMSVYEVILSNCGFSTVINNIRNRKTIIALGHKQYSDETVAVRAINLATPLCYNIEPFDGEKITVTWTEYTRGTEEEHLVCDIVIRN